MGPRAAGFLAGSCAMAFAAALFLKYDFVKKNDLTAHGIKTISTQADVIADRFAVVRSGFTLMSSTGAQANHERE